MKSTFVYPIALSLLLAVAPSYASEWERQMDARAMAQHESVTAGTTGYDRRHVHTNRQWQLDHSIGMDQRFRHHTGQRRDERLIRDWSEVRENRRQKLERGS